MGMITEREIKGGEYTSRELNTLQHSVSLITLLYSPVSYFKSAAVKFPVSHPVLSPAILSFFYLLSLLVIKNSETGVSAFALTFGWVVGIATTLLMTFFTASISYFFIPSENVLQKGWKLFIAYLVSQFPFVFLLPISFIVRITGILGWVFLFLSTGVLVLWVIVNMVIAVRTIYGVSMARAIMVVLIPGFFTWLSFVIFPMNFLVNSIIFLS